MNLLHKPSTQRVKSLKLDGDALLRFFHTMIEHAEINQDDTTDLVIHCLEPNDEFVVGTYVPEIHLVIRKVTDDPS